MNFGEIKKMARDMGLKTYGMKKTDMVRAIQRAENNIECYGTERVETCHEDASLFRAGRLHYLGRAQKKGGD